MNIYLCYEANYNSVAIDCSAADEIHLYSSWESVQTWLRAAIDRGLKSGFVLDESAAEELECIINTPADICLPMFHVRQDNFNENYDITVKLVELDY